MENDPFDRPVGRREARRHERRAAIVAAARRSFLDDGYAATSMSGLLKTLGGSKATLWSHFRCKEELFAAVIEDVTLAFRRRLEHDLVTPADLETTLSSFCRSFMSKVADADSVATWRLVVAESGRSPEIGRIFYDRAASHVERALTDYLTTQRREGRLHESDDPLQMAQLLIGLCAARHNKLLWGVTPVDPATIAADAARFSRYFMRLFATAG